MNDSSPNPTPVLDLDMGPQQFLDTDKRDAEDFDDDEKRVIRGQRFQPRYANALLSPPMAGPTPTDLEMIRHLVRMIRLFLFGKTVDEIEAGMSETRVETAEQSNVSIHAAAVSRLSEIANDMDPDKVLSATKTNANISEALRRVSEAAAELAPPQTKFKPR